MLHTLVNFGGVMDGNWNKSLVKEIDELIESINEFNKKWNKKSLNEMADIYRTIYDNDIEERKKLYSNALEYCRGIQMDKEFLESLKKDSKDLQSLNIANYLNETDKEKLNLFLRDYDKALLMNLSTSHFSKYNNLCQVVLLLLGLKYSQNSLDTINTFQIGDMYSQYCKRNFDLCLLSYDYGEKFEAFSREIFDAKTIPFIVAKRRLVGQKRDGYIIISKNTDLNSIIKDRFVFQELLNEDFLQYLKNKVISTKNTSLVDFVIKILREKKLNVPTELKKLKDDYEKTNEEIMVLDQRYYAEEQLKAEEEYRRELLSIEQEKADNEERFRRKQLEENRIMHEQLIENQNKQTKAIIDSRISELEVERLRTKDYREASDIQSKIDSLKKQKNQL